MNSTFFVVFAVKTGIFGRNTEKNTKIVVGDGNETVGESESYPK